MFVMLPASAFHDGERRVVVRVARRRRRIDERVTYRLVGPEPSTEASRDHEDSHALANRHCRRARPDRRARTSALYHVAGGDPSFVDRAELLRQSGRVGQHAGAGAAQRGARVARDARARRHSRRSDGARLSVTLTDSAGELDLGRRGESRRRCTTRAPAPCSSPRSCRTATATARVSP